MAISALQAIFSKYYDNAETTANGSKITIAELVKINDELNAIQTVKPELTKINQESMRLAFEADALATYVSASQLDIDCDNPAFQVMCSSKKNQLDRAMTASLVAKMLEKIRQTPVWNNVEESWLLSQSSPAMTAAPSPAAATAAPSTLSPLPAPAAPAMTLSPAPSTPAPQAAPAQPAAAAPVAAPPASPRSVGAAAGAAVTEPTERTTGTPATSTPATSTPATGAPGSETAPVQPAAAAPVVSPIVSAGAAGMESVYAGLAAVAAGLAASTKNVSSAPISPTAVGGAAGAAVGALATKPRTLGFTPAENPY
jgi:hypothetical protein